MELDFTARITALLNESQMTQADLCRKAKIKTSAMANYYTGKTKPKLESALKIAEALNISLDELTGWKPRALTPAESQLLNIFRELSESKQLEVINFANFTLDNEQKSASKRSSKKAGLNSKGA